ncbi:hypothetical protein [Pseudomonas sp. EL_65y_Pfl2_R95]|uniref:hypothetical protein n=1 Tax=Pseudomonas sp. EL_65y_Pfl2_R95 TaxID=3088698 RepID=UPI0030D850C4
MADPLDRAVSKAPETVGEGCLSRYDIDQLSAEDGADFSQAQALLKQTQSLDDSDPSAEQ